MFKETIQHELCFIDEFSQVSPGTVRETGWLREGWGQPPDAGMPLRVSMLVHVALQSELAVCRLRSG